MSKWEDEVNRHSNQLVKLTMKAADQGPSRYPRTNLRNSEW